MLCAGHVTPPWQVELNPDNFANSFEMNVGYVDAFRLWVLTVFDDQEHLARYVAPTEIPENWVSWFEQYIEVG
jgi:hypothetical protein